MEKGIGDFFTFLKKQSSEEQVSELEVEVRFSSISEVEVEFWKEFKKDFSSLLLVKDKYWLNFGINLSKLNNKSLKIWNWLKWRQGTNFEPLSKMSII